MAIGAREWNGAEMRALIVNLWTCSRALPPSSLGRESLRSALAGAPA